MSVSTLPAVRTRTSELLDLLGQTRRLAAAAGRDDLSNRLVTAEATLAEHTTRILVAGPADQGVTSLVEVLDRAPADQLPGVVFVSTPGGTPEMATEMATETSDAFGQGPAIAQPPADAALYVHDAATSYSDADLEQITMLRDRGLSVVGVISNIEACPNWRHTHRSNSRLLVEAGLGEPPIALLAVSTHWWETGRQRADQDMLARSGIPGLTAHIRQRLAGTVNTGLRDATLSTINEVADELATVWNSEFNTLGDPAHGVELIAAERKAANNAEHARRRAAAWQLAFADGFSELTACVDHDLRGRLRQVMRAAEEKISTTDPARSWTKLDQWLHAEVDNSVRANQHLAHHHTTALIKRIETELGGGARDSVPTVAPLRLDRYQPTQALDGLPGLGELPSGKPRLGPRLLNSLRGSYGGILMVGVLTSLAGMALVNAWSIAAGLLLGIYTFVEERTNRVERRRSEAKLAVSKQLDEVIFQVGDASRAYLRQIHRALRDHYTALAERLHSTSHAALTSASHAREHHARQRDARLAELHAHLSELRQLRIRAATLTHPRRARRPSTPSPAELTQYRPTGSGPAPADHIV